MLLLKKLTTKSAKPKTFSFSTAADRKPRRARFEEVIAKVKQGQTEKSSQKNKDENTDDFPADDSNAYLALIKKMKDLQAVDNAAKMNITEVDEVLADIEAEQSDREFEEAFNAERERKALEIAEQS